MKQTSGQSAPLVGVVMGSKSDWETMKEAVGILQQLDAGIPVATFAIGVAGAKNAALFAASLLAADHPKIAEALWDFRRRQTREALDGKLD